MGWLMILSVALALLCGVTVVFLPYRNPVRPCDYFMLRHALPDFRRVRLGGRHLAKWLRRKTPPAYFQTAANNQAVCLMMMLMLRYITGGYETLETRHRCRIIDQCRLTAPLPVVTSFSILGDVAKQIGGERIAVQSLVGANQDSHAYHMTSGDIKKIRSAKLVLLNGLGLEAADVQRAVKQSKVPLPKRPKAFRL